MAGNEATAGAWLSKGETWNQGAGRSLSGTSPCSDDQFPQFVQPGSGGEVCCRADGGVAAAYRSFR